MLLLIYNKVHNMLVTLAVFIFFKFSYLCEGISNILLNVLIRGLMWCFKLNSMLFIKVLIYLSNATSFNVFLLTLTYSIVLDTLIILIKDNIITS
jgi:hypothetical protein